MKIFITEFKFGQKFVLRPNHHHLVKSGLTFV